MKIKVEQRHIDAGVKNNPCSCPIALAVNEQTGRTNTHVHRDYIFTGGMKYFMPLTGYDFVTNFDMGYDVSPFEMELGGGTGFPTRLL